MVCAVTNNKKDIRGDSRTFPAVFSHSVKNNDRCKKKLESRRVGSNHRPWSYGPHTLPLCHVACLFLHFSQHKSVGCSNATHA